MKWKSYQMLCAHTQPYNAKIVAVSKTKRKEDILELYHAGHRIFGENKVQELTVKAAALPKEIAWHIIGHLQTNKVKRIIPFISMIQSVDSLRLLKEIDKQAKKYNRVIPCLLQIHIAQEQTKYGFSIDELQNLCAEKQWKKYKHAQIAGLMGMATHTENKEQIRQEFRSLKCMFDKLKATYFNENPHFKNLSMGMSGDYQIALEEGSTMIRVGSLIFGNR